MAVDMFLKFEGIDGESVDSKHKGEIDIESFSWGATNSGSAAHGGGAGAGRVAMQDFHFVMRVNKASPQLFLACASGHNIKMAYFSARKAGAEQQDFLKVTMSDILISSYKQDGSAGAENDLPMDQVSINFAKIKVDYSPPGKDVRSDGAVSVGWDVKKNAKL